MVPTTLQTHRLTLRPFHADDVADALAYRNDAAFAEFLPHIPQPFSLQDARAFVQQNMYERWDVAPTFAVVLEGTMIGTVNLEVDMATRSAMLGYAIGRRWWGKGIAIEAARTVVDWGVKTFALSRVWASTDAKNIRSQRVLAKLGFWREVLQANHHLGREGNRVAEVIYELDFDRERLA